MAPRPLPHHPGALAELAAENVEGTACLDRWKPLGLSLQQGSQSPSLQQNPNLLPGSRATTLLAWGSQEGGDRKGRGRPLGGTHLYFSFQSKGREAEGWQGGGGPTSHSLPSKAGVWP